jgi:hypothetical protein
VAALGEASALVGSFLTVISTFFLLYTIHLQQKIRNEEAVEAHWFELLKRWPEYAWLTPATGGIKMYVAEWLRVFEHRGHWISEVIVQVRLIAGL